jgi:hypothetical protein
MQTGRGRDEDRKIRRKRQGYSPRCTISIQIQYIQSICHYISQSRRYFLRTHGRQKTGNMEDLTKKYKRETDPRE